MKTNSEAMTVSYQDNAPRVSIYGAPMGRRSHRGDVLYSGKLYLRRIYLNNGGYDSEGTYWGHGAPLWWYASSDGDIDCTCRASSRAKAKEHILNEYPNARFYR